MLFKNHFLAFDVVVGITDGMFIEFVLDLIENRCFALVNKNEELSQIILLFNVNYFDMKFSSFNLKLI